MIKNSILVLSVFLIIACDGTHNPNAEQPVSPSHPRGANEIADSIDAVSDSTTEPVDFNKTKKDQTDIEKRQP